MKKALMALWLVGGGECFPASGKSWQFFYLNQRRVWVCRFGAARRLFERLVAWMILNRGVLIIYRDAFNGPASQAAGGVAFFKQARRVRWTVEVIHNPVGQAAFAKTAAVAQPGAEQSAEKSQNKSGDSVSVIFHRVLHGNHY